MPVNPYSPYVPVEIRNQLVTELLEPLRKESSEAWTKAVNSLLDQLEEELAAQELSELLSEYKKAPVGSKEHKAYEALRGCLKPIKHVRIDEWDMDIPVPAERKLSSIHTREYGLYPISTRRFNQATTDLVLAAEKLDSQYDRANTLFFKSLQHIHLSDVQLEFPSFYNKLKELGVIYAAPDITGEDGGPVYVCSSAEALTVEHISFISDVLARRGQLLSEQAALLALALPKDLALYEAQEVVFSDIHRLYSVRYRKQDPDTGEMGVIPGLVESFYSLVHSGVFHPIQNSATIRPTELGIELLKIK